ncbi:hypothetical protein Halsa_2255 [Halanaerobium hydrogeniformans]|uniref:Uncharacterized protein n=1 Tax=Halanaerobium hydrogeniformans TaxID=656519 RepID=E4RKL6_HALHG|nr:hypothetical protein Halsa_2255 [Halanaerobium hydrogeniformans]
MRAKTKAVGIKVTDDLDMITTMLFSIIIGVAPV